MSRLTGETKQKFFNFSFSLNIFYLQQISSNEVQYIQFLRKLGLEQKHKLLNLISLYIWVIALWKFGHWKLVIPQKLL